EHIMGKIGQVFCFMLLTFAVVHVARAGGDKEKSNEAPKEESTVAHDSKTRGALQVKSVGARPSDWFDVLQNGKRAIPGNPTLLNGTVELAPGTYIVEVNRTQRKVTIAVGKK